MKHFVLTLLGLLSFCLAIRAEVYSGECGDNGNNLTWTLDTETGKLVISGNGAMTQNPWRDYRNYIRTVDIQEGVKSIGDNAFSSCYLITNAKIPDSVIDIGDKAFYDCLGLKSIVIGRSVTSIGIHAFTSCSNLRTIINFSSLAITKGSTSNGSVASNAYQVVSNPNSIEENFVFSIIDGVNTLMAYIGDDTKIVLPDNYRGEGYVIGENAFYSNLTVTSIVIPDNVTSIGDWAFFNCRLLESINIPNSITDIGDWAFRQCSKLKNIILSNTLRSVGCRIFYDCIELESMEIPNSVTSIGKEAFYNCASLKDVTIGSNVMSIGEYAFASCETLANVKMPCSITKIEEYAFNGCEALTFIIIPPNVTSLGRRIFEGCRNLKTIINLSSIQFIISSNDNYSHMPSYSDIIKIDAPNGSIEGDYVFGIIEGTNTLCKYLGNDSDIILPYNYKGGKYRIGAEAFSNNETISNVMIPDGIINIGNDAFKYCTNLTGITIPNSVTSIGNRAFYSCTALKDVYCHAENVPSTDATVFNSSNYSNATLHVPAGSVATYKTTEPWSGFGNIVAFSPFSGEVEIDGINYELNGETKQATVIAKSSGYYSGEIVIPESVEHEGTVYSVTSIRDYAFFSCSGLTSVTIGNNVTSIGDYTFYECSGLASVTIGNSVTSIGNYAFSYCTGLTSVTIPNSVTSIGEYAFVSCKGLTSVHISDIAAWCNIDFGDSYSNPLSYAHHLYLNGEEVKDLVIPNSVTSIGKRAFYGCSGLTSVTIPNSVTSIGAFAFHACSGLTSVTIPNSVTSIGTSAFSGCTSLFNITIPSGISKIENYTFEDCISLTRITIPDNITEIGEYAFRGCRKINKLLIGSSVNSIQTNAFEYCSGLTLLVLPKSLRWVSSNAFHGCTNLKTVINFSSETPKLGEIDCGYAGYYAERIANRSDGNMYLDGDFVFNRTNSGNELLAYLGSDSYITLPDWSNNGDESYSISGGIFKNDKTVISITVPKSVIEIGSEAFYGTEWWNNQEDGLLYLDSWIIGYKGQSPKGEIIINDGTTGIANYAFEWCGITSVKIPNSVINIGYGAFYYCKSLSSITCLNPISPTCGNNAFYNVSTSSCQLLVPASAIEAYTTTSPWSTFTNIEALPLTDGEDFENTEEQELKTITYTRTLPNLYWNALYVPFEIPVSEIIDKYEVAYVNNVNSYDHNDDGTIDDMRMEVIKIKSGTLNANYPYLIKARNDEARSMNLTLENTTLFQSVETTIDCSSVFAKHEITGIYNKRYKNELPEGAMAISMAGAWQPIVSGSYLNPFRLYMTITARDGSPVKVEPAAMSRIRISVLGEDVETDIEETRSETKNIILDLSGRSVQKPVKGGVYIVNGKKVIF